MMIITNLLIPNNIIYPQQSKFNRTFNNNNNKFQKKDSIMGNKPNYFENQSFMKQYHAKQKRFLQGVPLYDSREIKFPLYTRDMAIVDSSGRRVKIIGVNWSGAHVQRQCVGGLNRQPMQSIIQKIHSLGFNTVRLTFSLQMLLDPNPVQHYLIDKNPQLYGKTPKQIFDITIKTLIKHGIMVCLNNHTSKSQWCCSDNDGDGLWWSKEFPTEVFEGCLVELAERYKDEKMVIGMDLRNQIRKTRVEKRELQPSWGDKVLETDWHMQSQKLANILHKHSPNWLIIIGGLNYQSDLTKIHKHPITLHTPNKLIYSGHLYQNFEKASQPNYNQFLKHYFNNQLYVRNLGAPYILGEFGHKDVGSQYWKNMMRMLKETDIDWMYWCLDGYKGKEEKNEEYGILWRDFKTINRVELVGQLQDVMGNRNIELRAKL